MKRMPVSFTTRLVAGSALRLILYVSCLLLLPFYLMSLVAGGEMLALTLGLTGIFAPSTLLFIYCYSKLGVFTDNINIIEKTLLSSTSVRIADIDTVQLDMINGARNSVVSVQLCDKNYGRNLVKDLEEVSFFKMLTYKPKGVLTLKTVQYQLRKKNAYRSAKVLIGLIKSNGNSSVKVVLPDEPSVNGVTSHREKQAYKFWRGFSENA